MSNKLLLGGGALVALGTIAVMFVIPAETGWDPTGVGKATGLVEIADPRGEETIRGEERMAQQDVLTLSETANLTPAVGVKDSWEYELAPFESVEFKYTIAEGKPITFLWEGSGPLHYDMHAHPFEGGTAATESYSIADAAAMGGTYIAAFTGIHGWYWQNRSMDTVTLKLDASGGMSTSTIFAGSGEIERPIAGAEPVPEGQVAGHSMQQPGQEAAPGAGQ